MEPIEASLEQLRIWASIDLSVFDQAHIDDKWKQFYNQKCLTIVRDTLSAVVEEQALRDIVYVKKLVQECELAVGELVLCDNAAAARCKDSLIIVVQCSHVFNAGFLLWERLIFHFFRV